MDRKKLVIVGLIVVTLLFLSGLGTTLVPKREEGMTSKRYIAGSKRRQGWEQSLGRLLAPFGPSLDINRLLRESDCKHTGRTILLTKIATSCVIEIPGSDERYRKGTLRRVGTGPAVTVAYTSSGEETVEQDLTKTNGSIRLAVLAEGGTLELSCLGCTAGSGRRAQVKFE